MDEHQDLVVLEYERRLSLLHITKEEYKKQIASVKQVFIDKIQNELGFIVDYGKVEEKDKQLIVPFHVYISEGVVWKNAELIYTKSSNNTSSVQAISNCKSDSFVLLKTFCQLQLYLVDNWESLNESISTVLSLWKQYRKEKDEFDKYEKKFLKNYPH